MRLMMGRVLLWGALAVACGDNIIPGLEPDGDAVDGDDSMDGDAGNDGMGDAMGDAMGTDALNPDGTLDALTSDALPEQCEQSPVALGATSSFVVLAGPSITSTGMTVIVGDMGTSPGTSVTGFGPGVVVGMQHIGNATSMMAQMSLTTAYNDAALRPAACATTVAGNLGGMTLTPGLYKSTGSLAVSSGDLVLDGQGDPDAVFIFQVAETLTTTGGRAVMLTNGAKASNVFWQVGTSATLGTGSVMVGTIMANAAISMLTNASLVGRALARIEGITLDTNAITAP